MSSQISLRSLANAWNEFFFAPQSPVPVALFRIFYGLLIIANLILLWPDWLTWYGKNSFVSLSTMQKLEPGTRIDLFSFIPQNDFSIETFFWVFLAAAILLTLGLVTRASSITVFLCLTSIQQRNLYITHSGDTFMRVAGFFLLFAPAGAALSIDRLIRLRRGKEGPEIQPRPPWAQRIIQFQLALLYFATFCSKATGSVWVNGTALAYVYQLDEFRRFPVPVWMHTPVMEKLETWMTLAIEFSMGTLIWFRELRYPILLVGVLFHVYLEYSLNVPLFQWEVLSAYILFVDPADLKRAWNYFAAQKWARSVTS